MDHVVFYPQKIIKNLGIKSEMISNNNKYMLKCCVWKNFRQKPTINKDKYTENRIQLSQPNFGGCTLKILS